MFQNCYDVAVVGGGPAGATAALLLARAGARTLLLASSPARDRVVTETLPGLAAGLLEQLGLWDLFCEQGNPRSEGVISVWGHPEPQISDFFSAPHGPGWSIDRTRFDAFLLAESGKAGAHRRFGTRLISLECINNDPWELVMVRDANVRRIRARYLVDATGRTRSACLRQLSSTMVIDRLMGVGTFFPERRTTPYLLIEAIDTGWFYSVALPDGRLGVIYFTDADVYAQARTQRKATFARQLDKAHRTRARVATDAIPENLLILSAATTRRTRVCGQGWIAVGDAALGFDPLSSLGIFKALDSASRASRHVINALDGKTENSSFENWSSQIFGHYLHLRERYYSRETRWQGSPFWARRQLPGTLALKSRTNLAENVVPPPP